MSNISDWFAPLARRALYVWVRATAFAESSPGIDPAKPVCYVLQDRHLSNLLVLFEESKRAGLPPAEAPLAFGTASSNRSFFFLNRSRGLGSTAPRTMETSPLLAELVRAVAADPVLDVQLVPVVILWGRSPDNQESILKALLAETWRAPGLLRQFLAVLLHGRQTMVRFNAPLSLRGCSSVGHRWILPSSRRRRMSIPQTRANWTKLMRPPTSASPWRTRCSCSG